MAPHRRLESSPPTFWNVLSATLKCMVGRKNPVTPRSARRDTIVLDAAVAVRGARFGDAATILRDDDANLTSDPACLNLMGVISEARGNWKAARRFYGMAMSLDPSYRPARHNMSRLYELATFGQSLKTIDLGDVELRATRRLNAKLMDRRRLLTPF
jgi:hypothetical protein